MLALLAALPVGCASTLPAPPTFADFVLVTTEQTYQPGDPIRFSLTNGSDTAVWYQLCAANVDLEQGVGGGEYRFVPEGTGKPDCILSLKLLPARQMAEGVLDLAVDLPAGQYRLSTNVRPSLRGDREGSSIIVTTSPINILP